MSPLSPFVPRLAVELGQLGVPSWTSIEGSMLSADISGFTALSERLAGKGKAGAEEITLLINTCFTALIDAAYLYGGEVIKFGGDALLIIFRGHSHQRRAVDAGLAMQAALHSSPAAKRAHLTMTVGIAEGPFDAFLVGSDYRELLVTGPQASEVIRLEGEADKGDTLVATTIATHLPPAMCVRQQAGGVVVVGSTGDAPTSPATRPSIDADLQPFVPRRVVEQLEAFAGYGGEHRLVTVGFVMVVGVAAQLARSGPAATAAEFGHVVDSIVAACDAFGVTVLHTDIAADGVKFVLCAGAPVNTGDTSDAMLQAALLIATTESPFVIRQGVQTGRVFAGFLGSEHRRTYTLMGDPVNTAARMLGKAGDREIVAVASVVADTRTVFLSDELEPFLVKGKTQPIVAHKVREATGRIRRDTSGSRLFGRQAELDVLTRAVGQLGQTVQLVGVAGVGKSRLLDAAWDAAEGLRVYQGACTPYGSASPYSVFRPLLRGGTGIGPDAHSSLAGDRLTELVTRIAPELLAMLPLLAVPFGARVASTPQADAIDPKFRRVQIHELVARFLDIALSGPTLLVVEDVHWIDDASGDLLNHLIRASADRQWAVIVTRRPEGGWQIDDDRGHVSHVHLEALDDAAVRQLAVEASTRSLTDVDLDLIVSRSQGNPLFAIELARVLADDSGQLPDTIEQIIASRIDRLKPAERRLVRVASVLGNQFDETVVASMLHDDDADTDVDEALAGAELSGAVARRSAGTWTFNHALYRDTAYEGLPFARRRRLHHQAATIIEDRALDAAVVAPLLSLHYAAARMYEQAWRYSLLAGSAAKDQHATSEAAAAYERALAAGRHCRHLAPADRSAIADQLGDLYYDLGRFDDAARVYRLARRTTADPVMVAGLIRKIGSVCERQGQPDRAIAWYARAARAVPAGTDAKEWLLVRAEIALAEAGLRARQNQNERCLQLARSARADTDRAGDARVGALALERIHLALTYLGHGDPESTGQQALEAYRDLDDRGGMARVLINLGIEAYFQSRWDEASDLYLEALDVAQRTGDVVLAATAAINSAEILSDQGEWGQASELLAGAQRNYTAVGYTPGIAASMLFDGVAACRDGRFAEAQTSFTSARGLLYRLKMVDLLDELDARELELDLLRGDASVAQCHELADRFGPDHQCTPRVRRLLGIAQQLDGDTERAVSTLLEVVDMTPAGSFEQSQTFLALAWAAPDAGDADGWRAEAARINVSLGIRRPPPMPPMPTSTVTGS